MGVSGYQLGEPSGTPDLKMVGDSFPSIHQSPGGVGRSGRPVVIRNAFTNLLSSYTRMACSWSETMMTFPFVLPLCCIIFKSVWWTALYGALSVASSVIAWKLYRYICKSSIVC